MTIPNYISYYQIPETFFIGSLKDEPPENRVLWLEMLRLKDKDGFVGGAVTYLARQANIPVEAAEKALEKWQQPDPASRIKAHEGRRIKEVDGGWLILSHQVYQEMLNGKRLGPAATSPNGANGHTSPSSNSKSRGISILDGKEKEKGRTATLVEPGRALVELPAELENPESWHPAEREFYSSLSVERQRELFVYVRGLAWRAAQEDKPLFHIGQEVAAAALDCSQRNISKILIEFQKLGCIERTAQGRYTEKRAAEYHYLLPTTLPIPAYAGADIEEDDPF